jgi:hypothetical protein
VINTATNASNNDNIVFPDIDIHFLMLLEKRSNGRAKGMVAVTIISKTDSELAGKTPILPIINPTP